MSNEICVLMVKVEDKSVVVKEIKEREKGYISNFMGTRDKR